MFNFLNVSFMYRDGHNYKEFITLSFENTKSQLTEQMLEDERDNIQTEEVLMGELGVPSIAAVAYETDKPHNDFDHCYVEITEIYSTDEPAGEIFALSAATMLKRLLGEEVCPNYEKAKNEAIAEQIKKAVSLCESHHKIESYLAMALSTAHLTNEDVIALGNKLSDPHENLVMKRNTGYFLKLLRYDEHDERGNDINNDDTYSPQLNAILTFATSRGYALIEFDCDADTCEHFPHNGEDDDD